jgi:hypothetical protein
VNEEVDWDQSHQTRNKTREHQNGASETQMLSVSEGNVYLHAMVGFIEFNLEDAATSLARPPAVKEWNFN